MNRRIIVIAVLFAAAGTSVYYIHLKSGQPRRSNASTAGPEAPERLATQRPASPIPVRASTAASPTNQSQSVTRADPSIASNGIAAVSDPEQYLASLYQNPIEFYGRVVDEKSNAVSAAQVRFMVADKYPEGITMYQRLSDDNGLFSLTGVRGVKVGVSAQKDGYYPLEKGSLAFTYAKALREPGVTLPTADSPALLVLKRKGTAETLVHLATHPAPIPKDGTPLDINLAAPSMVPSTIRVELRIFDQKTNTAGHYDWRCALSIPGGGFMERNGRFDFEAPSDGYQEFLEFSVFGDSLTWRVSLQKEFFVRFPDNRFARMSFHLSTAPRRTVEIESFLNPTPGSRNLEDDPAKLVEISQPGQALQ